jgi:two-component system response regulator YesN
MTRSAFLRTSDQADGPDVLAPHAASQRVLIVEDETHLREMLHTSLTEMGLIATAVSTAEAALRLINQHFFALALIDLNLPGMGGLELCETLHERRPHIQAIILTGFGDLDSARQAIRLEVVDFLTKPCGMDDLEHALNRARLRWLDRWSGQGMPAVTEPAVTNHVTKPASPANDSGSLRSMEEMERELILASLASHNGNRQAAASDLGISVRKLYYRLQQYQRQGLLKEE